MTTLLRMLEESQGKLEQQMRENAELRLNLKELEMIDRTQVPMGQPQDSAKEEDNSLAGQNKKLKAELKAAYSELAELKQQLAMKDRKISQLQSRNTAQMSNCSNNLSLDERSPVRVNAKLHSISAMNAKSSTQMFS